MPTAPVRHGRTLAAALLLAIAAAAPAQTHWAFVPPVRPAVPAVTDTAWPRNDVDRFVLARLERQGMAPSPEATRGELLRRVTFDLTGLPPTLGELDAFEHDERPDAYERVVDALLARPAAAEESTRLWLDLARYADTHGMERDQVRALWRWRDRVLDDYAANMPFDRFVEEQLAGDLLPDATLAQRLASGFNRCNPTSDEGGLIPEEYLARYAMNRTDTFGTVFLGLTVGCAQCHDHKYDPLLQRDYYRLLAYFASFREDGNDGGVPAPAPALLAPRPDEARELARLRADAAALQAELDVAMPSCDAAQQRWEAEQTAAAACRWRSLACTAGASDGALPLERLADGSLRGLGQAPARGDYEVLCEGELGGTAALRLVALPDEDLPEHGPGRAGNGNFVLTAVELAIADGDGWRDVAIARADASFAQPGFAAAGVLDGEAETGWALQGRHAATPLYLTLAKALPAGTTRLRVRLRQQGRHQAHLLGRFALAASEEAPGELPATLLASFEGLGDGDGALRRDWWRDAHVDGHRQVRQRAAAAARAVADYEAKLPQCMVSQDLEQPRQVHVLVRGRYDQPAELVTPGTPAFLPPLPADAPADRRALAAWLLSPQQPLFARVAVNRLWLRHFGRGLVATPHDFGVRGERPSHPLLLDWLACEFRERGFDERAMHRLLVTSATYRQSAHATDAQLQRDADDVWLGRMRRQRLPAEAIRDQALAASGLLVDRFGGPSLRIPQPPGIWEAVAFPGSNTEHYVADSGDAVHRRSLYTFWKRTAPPPLLTTLDAPSREQCVVERQVTNTPLQVLALWNDEGMLEAARALAQRCLAAGGDDAARLQFAFRTLLQRAPTAAETAACAQLLQQRREDGEIGAWTLLANLLLGLDEALHRN